MTSTAVRVGLRVRPLTEKEIVNNCTECITCIPDAPQILIGADKSFTYDYVFNTKTDQSQVYQQAASPLLHKFIDGFNATILAYGQTGSGKTYSMGTSLENTSSHGNEGIVPRCIVELFEILKNREAQDPEYKYEIYVSFLELYNEDFIDLLNNTQQTKRRSQQQLPQVTEVSIREDITGHIYWTGVKEEICYSPQDVLNHLAQGSLNRTTGSTEMNSVSSRSHAIFSVLLKQQKPLEEDGKKMIKSLSSKFHFVDLAGSERLKRTHAQGDRAREGIAINSGLLALGNVISALGDEARKATHIPYRDSKLTRLLQDSLGGNSQTLMLACVSPADTNFQETLSTLKYANRARNIKNRVSINQEFTGSSVEVNQLKALVSKLRLEIAELRTTQPQQQSSCDTRELQERIQQMSAQIIQLTSERDTLLIEREMGEFMQNDHDEGSLLENIGTARTVNTHPLIEKYQQTIQDLRNQLLDSQAKVKAMEQERAVIQKFSQPSKKPSVSSSSSKRHAARIKMRRTVISTSATLRKKHKKTKKRKEDDEDEGIVNDFQEQDVRQEEVKESIAKVRADIRKSLEVLELVKPLEESSYEEELKVFEAEERDLQQQRQENELFLSSLDDYIRDIETLEVPVWKNEEFKDSKQSQSSDENTVQSRISQQPYVAPSKYTEKLSKMLHQIQSDIKVKEELVSHLEKSETEFAFMRKKFDEKINVLQAQLVEMQKEKDMALMRTKSNMAIKADIKQQVEPEIRQEYESKIKQLHAKIQDLTRKYTSATSSVQSARNQNESALKTLKLNIQRLEAEKKRLAQRMRAEAERVREQFSRQERKIQQLQRQQAQYNQAKKRLEREHEEQKNVLRKRNEEIMMSTSQLKQTIAVMKKAVREGGILDEKMLAKLAPILGGHFAVIARGGGHGFPKKKKKNPIPLTIRISRKKQLLDRALAQYIQGKQAIFEMEQLLLRREKLVKEKLELEEEREHVYEVERDHEESTGQPMDMIAIELMDERIEDISAEISYLTSRVRCLQKEAAVEDSLQQQMPAALMDHRKAGKHVTFVDEIVPEIKQVEEEWVDIDMFEEQYSLPMNTAPEIAYEMTCKLIKSFEQDEYQSIIEGLVDDVMELKMNEYENHNTLKSMEETIIELKRTINTLKDTTNTTTTTTNHNHNNNNNHNHNNADNINTDEDLLNLMRKRQILSLPNSPIASPHNILLKKRDSITPSPDRFYNMIQKRLSREEEEDDETIEQYIFDHESSTSSIRSIHLRRGSNDDEDSIRRPSPIIKNKSVFDRLAQTPTRSSKAKMNNRHSSSSVEELKKGWDIENVHRPQSVTTGRF